MGFVSADPTNAQKAYYRWNSASPLFCCILLYFILFIFILFLFYFYFIFILFYFYFYFILFYPHPLVLPAIPRQLGALAKETAFYSHATGMLQAC